MPSDGCLAAADPTAVNRQEWKTNLYRHELFNFNLLRPVAAEPRGLKFAQLLPLPSRYLLA